MQHKYGEFSTEQIRLTKEQIRKKIFFLLLYVDPKTQSKFTDINVDSAFFNLLSELGGLNSILRKPQELVLVISLLEAAWMEYNDPSFSFKTYRKLILDAGAETMKIREVD